MRKYFQIIVVLGSFFFVVFLKSLKDTQDQTRFIINPIPFPAQSSLPMDTILPQNTATPQGSSMMPPSAMPQMMGTYKNGTYTGTVEDAYYGYLQVQAVIQSGRISDVIFLQYPSDNRTSMSINSQAMPMLKQEAIQTQNAQVDIISGASESSGAFQKSLASALASAK